MTRGMWTLPNALTGLRLLAVPFLGAVLAVAGDTPGGRWVALALFAAASLTDLADGWLARRWGQCTDFGALVDPIADKALVATALVCLSARDLVPWWATVVVLAREVAVTVLRLTVLQHGVIPASRGGKLKTAAQTTMIVLALAAPEWTAVLTAVVVLTVAWTVLTGLDYGAKAAALTRARRPALQPPAVSPPHAPG
ncbi:CDP-diacylglycerol--glycerol-3-phosphate 3-phosphatidyltransferase [Geodermatophilus dictyosporus]|uniref:CDP-diacylglycerol--glycerol-3-phosphate 3-phosphatidyltransferase n=1 Tax=Geodermatophilus dictyosporus TaxID=1523247 RepID=A0A1I5LYC8_9ACTN|nr:CDP-diacylglycerol--glycerol-3-phosphate 3-phosphatidyltransferase [Geodermatophilus dictyosporus]SFP02329.1 CDP-diacylglycerol--glycerol-3-phosphate 3-phosphatidyltransferase [Geodermatophilus dictyosporus]